MTSQTIAGTPARSPARESAGSRPLDPPFTGQRELDLKLRRLRDGAPAFAALPIGDRIALARAMLAGYHRVAERSVRAACAAKGIRPGTPLEGEEWLTGPCCVQRHLRLVVEQLEAIAQTGTTSAGALTRTIDGRVAMPVFPSGGTDRILFGGITAEAHFRDGLDAGAVGEGRASFYRHPTHRGRTLLVLGAGNIASILAMDVITKLFNEGAVCLLKMNPVNAYLGPFVEEAFEPAIARGFVAVAYGGAEEGSYLARHDDIDQVHLTGSEATYDAVVWGPAGPEREARRTRNEPLLSKPVSAELGCVSPVLVVPGPYSAAELAFQAESITGMVTANASFLCNAAKVLVTPRGWRGRRELVGGIERVLAATPLRDAYYPGAAERWQRLVRGRDSVRTIGSAGPGQLPWTLLPGLDPADGGESAFRTESFCPILAETEVASDDPLDYLARAVDFVNGSLWGTLSATVVVHPSTMKDPVLAEAVERALTRLRYGTVAVNTWSGLAFAFGSPPWGAHPSSTPTDIQSGEGWVHNTLMLEGVEKVVLRHPLTRRPKPVFFPSHRTAHLLGRRLAELEARPGWARVAGVVGSAMRG